jgi:hypothetical protein
MGAGLGVGSLMPGNYNAPKEERRPKRQGGVKSRQTGAKSALTCLEFLLGLVDDIDAAFAAHDLTITVALLERPERILDLHRPSPSRGAQAPASDTVLHMQG